MMRKPGAMISGDGNTRDNSFESETLRDLEDSGDQSSPPTQRKLIQLQKKKKKTTKKKKKDTNQMDFSSANGFSTFSGTGATTCTTSRPTKDCSGSGSSSIGNKKLQQKDTALVLLSAADKKKKKNDDDDDDCNDSVSSSGSTSSSGRRSIHGFNSFFLHRKVVFATLILFVGAFASAAFLSIGISSERDDQTTEFERLADEFVVKLQGAFSDYELFGLWIHESCRERANNNANAAAAGRSNNNNNSSSSSSVLLGICSRQDFRDLYEYIVSVGLDFQSAQFMPYVPHDKREAVEAEARAFYEANYDYVKYRGIVGLFFNDGVQLLPQDEKEFYWPVHYIEPVEGNEAAIDLDLYSSPTQKKNIEHSVREWLPSVTDRLRLVQETDPSAYSIILHHPGIRLSTHNESDAPNGVALMVIRIPALMARTNNDATESASFYIYDSTHTDKDPVFLGAHTVYVQPDHMVLFNGLPEIPLEELEDTVDTRLELREVVIADRTWTIAVVSLPGTYQPEVLFVILGGVIIFMASLILSTCFWAHMTRASKLNAIRNEAAQEKAQIIVETARKQALAERQLNEYIAHEVRNPLSSAIAALSFVSAASKETEQTAEEKQVVQGDLKIIDASLQFINELLRNMLDMHRAANQQMKITLAPTDLRNDVLEPVASILHMRGNKVEIITDCPPNICVMSDRLRLKQIVLNLAVNSTKFVENGFIKLKCVVRKDQLEESVQIHLEDSGPGIPMEKRGNLFAKFQESLDLMNQGTGIGLCLCKHLTNLMNGDLWLDEDYDSGIEGCPGTKFVLDLHSPPLSDDFWDENQSLLEYDKFHQQVSNGSAGQAPNPQLFQAIASSSMTCSGPAHDHSVNANGAIGQTEAKPPNAEPIKGPQQQLPTTTATQQNHQCHQLPEKLNVLFCDDDMVLRKLFVRSLKRVAPGWNVQEAANGETAISLAEKDPAAFEVIFLDQYMSSIDKQLLGTETTRELRAKGVTCRIVGLSANDAEQAFLDAGADYFLFKPFPCEPGALKRALLEVIFAASKSCRNLSAEEEQELQGQDHGAVSYPEDVEDLA